MRSRKLSMQDVDVKVKVCICQYHLQQLCPQSVVPRSHQKRGRKAIGVLALFSAALGNSLLSSNTVHLIR